MDLVSVETSNVLVPVSNTDIVVVEHDSIVAGERLVEVVLTTNDTSNILVEVETSTVILAGQPGPPGAPSEDTIMYSKRVDFNGDTLLYKGEALPGTLNSAPNWRISKVEILPDGDVITTWASGSADFSFVWDNRAGYTYV
jgi:hypothetical protein